jgi:zinc transporter
LRRDIVDIRKISILFRRHLAPQRDAISQLRTADLDWLDDTDRRYLLESFNHIIRYVEELDAIRERAQIVKDELASLLADRMNRNTYVLSVIAAIFLPLGFLTGLFGINIGGMPGVENGMAFLIFCLFLAVLVPVQIWLFKKLNWF